MAVIYTYSRRSNHDAYFFEEPTRSLGGRIETPRFNLHNEVMVRKHVHAAVLSELILLSRSEGADQGQSALDLEELREVRERAFPSYLVTYLFENERTYRHQPYDVSILATVISKHNQHSLTTIQRVFAQYWPETDRYVVTATAVEQYIDDMPMRLQAG